MGIRLSIAQIVDRNDLNVILFAAFVMRAKDVAADAAVAVNCDTYGHLFLQKKSKQL
jgi:hypothetical protein